MQKGMVLPKGILDSVTTRYDGMYVPNKTVTIFGVGYSVLFEEAGRFFFLSLFSRPTELFLLERKEYEVEVLETAIASRTNSRQNIIVSWYQKLLNRTINEKNTYY